MSAPLNDAFDDLFRDRWPGQLRSLLDIRDPKPLMIGVSDAIAEAAGLDDAERKRLARLMGAWTSTIAYQKALSARGAMRCDLDGNPVEPVSPDHSAWALQRIYRARMKRERRVAEAERIRAREAAEAARQQAKMRASVGNASKPVLRLGRPA